MTASVFGNLPRSGALAPRGSGAAGASSHTDDEARTARPGSTPIYRDGGGWATWAVFLVGAYLIYRITVR